ncbi:hypothetical protein HK098_008348 [Nowakowskiella sp. JEL0407]|nr:hypothetical protein HK098_008348 [Nowakowskiella sp. JEL0407]
MSDYYDVFLSYRVLRTLIWNSMETAVLGCVEKSRVCVPIISNKLIRLLNVEEGKTDNVLLEWDVCFLLFFAWFIFRDCNVVLVWLDDVELFSGWELSTYCPVVSSGRLWDVRYGSVGCGHEGRSSEGLLTNGEGNMDGI